MLNLTTGPIELKFEDIPTEGMGFKMKGLDYNHMGPIVEFPASVTGKPITYTMEDLVSLRVARMNGLEVLD